MAWEPTDWPEAARRQARLLVFQWHITERCNRRCRHCYQEGYSGPELGLDDLLDVMEQFKALLADRNRASAPRAVRGHINVTGGEPFVRGDFLDLLEAFHANRRFFTFGILTNGTFIDAEMARRLRDLGVDFVQVSMEGGPATNDSIRGPGATEQTRAALTHLVRERISTAISFTAQRSNYREFPEVVRIGRELGVTRVWSDRLVPWGSGAADEVLTPEETRAFFEIMYRAHAETVGSFCRTRVHMGRALQFLVGGGRPYRCAAGDWLVTVEANGDVLPCRRMPIRVGNVLETPLTDIYHTNELLRDLRDRDRVPEGCEGCRYLRACGGGLRCLAYAVTGDPFTADPGCWRAAAPGSVGERTSES